MLTIVSAVWFIAVAAVIFSAQAFSDGQQRSQTVAIGAIYFSAFLMAMVLTVMTICPALLVLQPLRLLKVLHAYRDSITPRQRFRGMFSTNLTISGFEMYHLQPCTLIYTIRRGHWPVAFSQAYSLQRSH